MEKNEKLVLIDGNSLINRAFYALPLLKNSTGEYSNAVYGFCNILIKLIEAEKPKYMAVAFDLGYPTFRHEMYAEYKAGRKKMPEELACQLPVLKKVLAAMNITFIEQKGIEADDLIGTLANKFDVQTIIVSGDRDLFQLVNDKNSVWFTKKGITEAVIVTPQNIKEIYGVNADEVVDLKALMGDSSDNIKGVAGIGDKTAKKLIEQFGHIENIYRHIEELPKTSNKLKLIDGEESAKLSKQLATIKTDVELDYRIDDLIFDFPFKKDVYNIFKHYEFNTILKRPELFDDKEIEIEKKVVKTNVITSKEDIEKLLKNLSTTNTFSFDFNDNEINVANSKFEENIIKITENNLNLAEILLKFKDFLQNSDVLKIVLNAKNIKHLLKKYDIELNNFYDENLALYLLSGSQKTDYDKKSFCEKYGYEEQNICAALYAQKSLLDDELKKESMFNLYNDIELPLVSVLFEMEQNGFKVDVDELKAIGEEYKKELQTLTQKIYLDAGEEFNIKSPKQVGIVLFEHLGLKMPRGMKKSTGVEVLERLENAHPIISKILRFRKIEKLVSTYIEPFLELADKDNHLIHTIFNQTLTSTGRLSSSEPNLQNIPIRNEEGKILRKIFIPRSPNGKIITSDYSQIELRLMAHFSQDSKLLEAYQNDIDIHAQTASDIFEVPLNFVTDKMRRDAKAVNFGIIYGISDYGLSQNINCSRAEAKLFIEKYFATYTGVKHYLDDCVENAKQNGYVTTLFGRKRNIEELKSENYMTRLFGERAAMNMPLQGTASDIIKIAMISVYKEFKKQNLKSKLILQIHDELLVDAVAGEEEIVKSILKDCMESATKLSVPLIAQIGEGKTWFDAK